MRDAHDGLNIVKCRLWQWFSALDEQQRSCIHLEHHLHIFLTHIASVYSIPSNTKPLSEVSKVPVHVYGHGTEHHIYML